MLIGVHATKTGYLMSRPIFCLKILIHLKLSGLQIRVFENYFSYFSMKTDIVCTQKNRLNEMVLLSTQNTCLN